MVPGKAVYGVYGSTIFPPPARQEVVMSMGCPGVSNKENPSCGGTASAVELLGTGICKDAKVRRILVLGQLALTPYGSAIASVGKGIISAHEATLCDDDGTVSPSVEALVCMKTRPWQKKECDLRGVGMGVDQAVNMSYNVTR